MQNNSQSMFLLSHPDLLQQFQRTIVSLLPHLDLSLNEFQENGFETMRLNLFISTFNENIKCIGECSNILMK